MNKRFLSMKDEGASRDYLDGYKEGMMAVQIWNKKNWVNPNYVKQLKEEYRRMSTTNENLRNRIRRMEDKSN